MKTKALLILFGLFVAAPAHAESPAPAEIAARSAEVLGRLQLLKEGKFVELEAQMVAAQQAFEKDSRTERAAIRAFRHCETTDPEADAAVKRWVAASPGSYAAQGCAAILSNHLAFAARGAKWAPEVSDEKLKLMVENHAKAFQSASAALKLNPKLLVANNVLIDIGRANGAAPEKIRKIFDAAAKECPACLAPRVVYMKSLWPRWGGSIEAMASFAAESEKLAGQNSELRMLRGYIDSDAGDALSRRDENAQALIQYQKAASLGAHEDFLERAGDSERDLKDYSKALESYQKALAVNPEHIQSLLGASKAAVQLKQLPIAIAYFEVAKTLDPKWESVDSWQAKLAAVLRSAGYQAYQQGQFEPAKQALDRAVGLDPASADTLYWRGRASLQSRNWDAALVDFRKALEVDPTHFESAKNIDWIYAQRGDWQSIVKMWDAFLVRSPRHAGAYFERAGTYHHMGDQVHAQADAKKACELGNSEACRHAR